MQRILIMAFRNSLRNKRRSFLAVLSIVGAMIFMCFMQGMIGGITESLVRNSTRNTTGHIRISHPQFEQKEKFLPVTDNLQNPHDIIEKIEAIPELKGKVDIIAPRITFGVVLENKGKNKIALGFAGDPSVEKNLIQLESKILEGGRYIQNNREMVIGAELAKLLEYSVRDTVKVMTQGSDYALHLRKFAIVGIFKTGLVDLDKNLFQIDIPDAQKLLRMGGDVQQIVVMLKNYHDADWAASLIRKKIGGESVAVTSWTQIGWSYDYVQMANGAYAAIFWIIGLFAAFIIGNIMMMVVMERKKEIGILKSMGFSPKKIALLFLSEGAILGLTGTIIGIIMGLTIIIAINNGPTNGFDFTQMMQGFEGFPMDYVVKLRITAFNIVNFIILGITVSTIVTLLPSWKAAKMNVVDAIKSI